MNLLNLTTLLVFFGPYALTPLWATEPADLLLCEDAIESAMDNTQVPRSILSAVSIVETNYQGSAGHPWTVNASGKGHYFASKSEAVRFAQNELTLGNTNIDIGCFQLNIKWHSRNFVSLEEMLDPKANARYAAVYLEEMYASTGSWEAAIGAYHSKNLTLAAAYSQKVQEQLLSLDQGISLAMASDQPIKASNNYPLLQQRNLGSGSTGSLVPNLPSNRSLMGLY
jgi:hypothetical protein